MKNPIKVLIVDDSAFIRKALEMMLKDDPRFQVVGTAKNGLEGVELCKKVRPDVVTMDVEMPVMDGLAALKKIMEVHPTPVIMISTLTLEGAEVTIKALELGAVDFIPKNINSSSAEIVKIKNELYQKLLSASQVDFSRYQKSQAAASTHFAESLKLREKQLALDAARYKIIAIASSTGGPKTLQSILQKMPPNLPVPIVIAQHMPPMFTNSFAKRLDDILPFSVLEADHNMEIEPGKVYIGKGGYHLKLIRLMNRTVIKLIENSPGHLYKPSGDLLFESVAEIYRSNAIGVILTGMGDDGAKGLLKLKQAGAYTIAQDESTSLIYGMPKVAAELGAAKSVLPDYRIPDKLSLLLASKSDVHHN